MYLLKGTKYLALPSTPSEFVSSGGTGVNQVFIDRMLGPWKGDASKLFPANSAFASHVVSGAIFNADDVAPAPVNVILNGTTITWGDSPSNDVIGYYVYENDVKIGTIRDGSSNTFTIGTAHTQSRLSILPENFQMAPMQSPLRRLNLKKKLLKRLQRKTYHLLHHLPEARTGITVVLRLLQDEETDETGE